MKIAFDHDVDSQGNIVGTHFIDTSDPAVQSMLTALKSNVAAQTTAGYGIVSKMPTYTNQTRWQAILGEAIRLNDVTARGLLGV